MIHGSSSGCDSDDGNEEDDELSELERSVRESAVKVICDLCSKWYNLHFITMHDLTSCVPLFSCLIFSYEAEAYNSGSAAN